MKGPQTVATRRSNVWLVVLALLVLFLAIAWYDGGREPQRMIEQPIALPGATS
jgi:hypothetical protein